MLRILIGVLMAAGLATPSFCKDIDPAKVSKQKLNIVDNIDRFNGARVIAAKRGLSLDGTGLLNNIDLNPVVLVRSGEQPIFFVRLYYNGLGWAFLNGKLEFIVDGKRYSAIGDDSSGHRKVGSCSSFGCMVEEIIRVPASPDLIDAIANARSAEVRALGSNTSLVGSLDEKHVAYFAEMQKRFTVLNPAPNLPATTEITTAIAPADALPTTTNPRLQEAYDAVALIQANPLASRAQLLSSGMGCGIVSTNESAATAKLFTATCPGAKTLKINCQGMGCKPAME